MYMYNAQVSVFHVLPLEMTCMEPVAVKEVSRSHGVIIVFLYFLVSWTHTHLSGG